MNLIRRKTKVVKVGNVYIGGKYPIAIQSMTKTKTADIKATVQQINTLDQAGCEIVRLAVKDNADALALRQIKKQVKLPIVADIHFNWQFAVTAIESGVDKIRLNPGNIYKKAEIKEVASAAKLARIPIRVGVNSGSVKANHPEADLMVKSALEYIKILESFKFRDIVVSLKGSNILDTIEAYTLFSRRSDYPLHLGVTATGTPYAGAIKSSVGIGNLLLNGIGDTFRVSLTENPVQEVKAARAILEAVGLRHFGPEIISCPTCGRCEVGLVKLVKDLEAKLATTHYPLSLKRPVKIAVMGCIVNGPGEAKEADLGVAFGRDKGLLFKHGKPIRKISFANCLDILLKELRGFYE